MRILVTGGCGFIGSHLVERLVRDDHEVSVIDRRPFQPRGMSAKPKFAFQLSAGDARCGEIIREQAIDCIFHLAFDPVTGDGAESAGVLHANRSGLGNILYQAHVHRVDKVVVLSSTAVYGCPDGLAIDEASPLQPVDEEGFRFLTYESICRDHRTKGMNVVLVRTGHVFGPLQTEWNLPLATSDLHPRDLLYVGDLVDALARIIENPTSPVLNVTSGRSATREDILRVFHPDEPVQGTVSSQDRVACGNDAPRIDNSRAIFELDWVPHVGFEEGLKRTAKWKRKQTAESAAAGQVHPLRKRLSSIVWNQKDIVVVGLFLLSFIAIYLVQYRLRIDADWLVPYIIIVNILYGLKQGSLGIALAVSARILFQLYFNGMRLIDLLNDVSSIVYLAMYIVVGVIVGYVIDHRRRGQEYLLKELESVQEDLKFFQQTYQKTNEVKWILQNTIENYSDSFGKSLEIINRLNQVEPELIYPEAARIIAHFMKAGLVHIYHVNSLHRSLRLAAVTGARKYANSILFDQLPGLEDAIAQSRIVINRELDGTRPLVYAPILNEEKIVALVMIDQVEFRMMNQQFANTLKVITMLIANSLAFAGLMTACSNDRKYIQQSLVIQMIWFRRILEAMLTGDQESLLHVSALRVVDPIEDYQGFSRQVAGLVRESDMVGEIADGQVGIVLMHTRSEDMSIVQRRFLQQGIRIEISEIRNLLQ